MSRIWLLCSTKENSVASQITEKYEEWKFSHCQKNRYTAAAYKLEWLHFPRIPFSIFYDFTGKHIAMLFYKGINTLYYEFTFYNKWNFNHVSKPNCGSNNLTCLLLWMRLQTRPPAAQLRQHNYFPGNQIFPDVKQRACMWLYNLRWFYEKE